MKKFLISVICTFSVFFAVLTIGGAIIKKLYPIAYREIVCEYYDDWRLILSIVKAESGFRPDVTSNAGACGLMQILPSTAEFIAEKNGIEEYDLYEPRDNLHLGCLYFMYLEEKFSNLQTVLAAYNAGEGTVKEWLKDSRYSSDGVILSSIPYTETKNYVIKIKKYYQNYRKIYLTN